MRYCVLTWDTDRQRFTEQDGVPGRHLTLWGLRRALRRLQGVGYTCHRNVHGSDLSVLVKRDTWPLVAQGAGCLYVPPEAGPTKRGKPK